MSAIAGICNWDRQPASPTVTSAFARQSRLAGPDGGSTVTPQPWLALQANVLHFDRLSTTERQPIVFGRGSVLTWDGRLDNRSDLLLCLHRYLGEDQSDAAVVAAAYARWGTECIRELIGDWSVAIWDVDEQKVVLARDYAGNRPLYVYRRPNQIAWATCLEALVHGLNLTEPNEQYIAARLTFVKRPDLAPYAGVFMLRAGHLLISRANHDDTIKRYWTFSTNPIAYSEPRDYTDRLRELLTDAVKVRLRSNRPVWSQLSGGLDTSSLVCIAHRLIARGEVEAPKIQPHTWVFTFAPEDHELSYVEDVEEWCGIKSIRTSMTRYRSAEEVFAGGMRPKGWGRELRDEPVRQAGDRFIFTGWPGDTVMHHHGAAKLGVFEYLRRGHLLQFVSIFFKTARVKSLPLSTLVRTLLFETRNANSDLYLRRPVLTPDHPHYNPFTLAPSLMAQVPSAISYEAFAREFPLIKRPLVREFYRWADYSVSSDAVPDVWFTHPFMHRPLVEFSIAVPPLALWNPFRIRDGHKTALADVLPPSLIARVDKVFGETIVARSFTQRGEEFDATKSRLGPPDSWQLVARGYIDKDNLARALAEPQARRPRPATFIMIATEIEGWLRTLSSLTRDPRVRNSTLSDDRYQILVRETKSTESSLAPRASPLVP